MVKQSLQYHALLTQPPFHPHTAPSSLTPMEELFGRPPWQVFSCGNTAAYRAIASVLKAEYDVTPKGGFISSHGKAVLWAIAYLTHCAQHNMTPHNQDDVVTPLLKEVAKALVMDFKASPQYAQQAVNALHDGMERYINVQTKSSGEFYSHTPPPVTKQWDTAQGTSYTYSTGRPGRPHLTYEPRYGGERFVPPSSSQQPTSRAATSPSTTPSPTPSTSVSPQGHQVGPYGTYTFAPHTPEGHSPATTLRQQRVKAQQLGQQVPPQPYQPMITPEELYQHAKDILQKYKTLQNKTIQRPETLQHLFTQIKFTQPHLRALRVPPISHGQAVYFIQRYVREMTKATPLLPQTTSSRHLPAVSSPHIPQDDIDNVDAIDVPFTDVGAQEQTLQHQRLLALQHAEDQYHHQRQSQLHAQQRLLPPPSPVLHPHTQTALAQQYAQRALQQSIERERRMTQIRLQQQTQEREQQARKQHQQEMERLRQEQEHQQQVSQRQSLLDSAELYHQAVRLILVHGKYDVAFLATRFIFQGDIAPHFRLTSADAQRLIERMEKEKVLEHTESALRELFHSHAHPTPAQIMTITRQPSVTSQTIIHRLQREGKLPHSTPSPLPVIPVSQPAKTIPILVHDPHVLPSPKPPPSPSEQPQLSSQQSPVEQRILHAFQQTKIPVTSSRDITHPTSEITWRQSGIAKSLGVLPLTLDVARHHLTIEVPVNGKMTNAIRDAVSHVLGHLSFPLHVSLSSGYLDSELLRDAQRWYDDASSHVQWQLSPALHTAINPKQTRTIDPSITQEIQRQHARTKEEIHRERQEDEEERQRKEHEKRRQEDGEAGPPSLKKSRAADVTPKETVPTSFDLHGIRVTLIQTGTRAFSYTLETPHPGSNQTMVFTSEKKFRSLKAAKADAEAEIQRRMHHHQQQLTPPGETVHPTSALEQKVQQAFHAERMTSIENRIVHNPHEPDIEWTQVHPAKHISLTLRVRGMSHVQLGPYSPRLITKPMVTLFNNVVGLLTRHHLTFTVNPTLSAKEAFPLQQIIALWNNNNNNGSSQEKSKKTATSPHEASEYTIYPGPRGTEEGFPITVGERDLKTILDLNRSQILLVKKLPVGGHTMVNGAGITRTA